MKKQESRASAFSEIYEHRIWGNRSRSGPGSDLVHIKPYLNFIQRFIKDRKDAINTIVDVGCGDWTLGSRIDWGDASYLGVDIVPSLIKNLNERYAGSNRSFVCADVVTDELPPGDLVILKDVLQHLSNESVALILAKIRDFKHVVIVNDVKRYRMPFWPLRFPRKFYGELNGEIEDGGWRPLDIRMAPFNEPFDLTEEYIYKLRTRTRDVKLILAQ